jgi:hypothetical protein
VLRKVFLIFLGVVTGAAVTLVAPQPRTVVEASSATAAAEALQQLRLFSHVFERVRSATFPGVRAARVTAQYWVRSSLRPCCVTSAVTASGR